MLLGGEVWPVEVQISEKLRAIVGFRDDRVRIVVRTGLPAVGELPLDLVPSDMEAVARVQEAQDKWLRLPAAVRGAGAPGWPIELPISRKVRARVGLPDDRVEIAVKTPVPLLTVTLKLRRESMEAIREAREAQSKWLRQPEFIRRNGGHE